MEDKQTPESTTSIRLLIADEISRTISYLHAGLNSAGIEICGVARKPSALFEEVKRSAPDVIMVNEQFGGTDILETINELVTLCPEARIVILSQNPASSPVNPTNTPAVSAVIEATTPVDEIVSLLQKISGKNAEPEEELAPIQEVIPRRIRKKAGKGEVFMVFAGKGGVGKSTVATNLAAALSEQSQGRVVIIDLDLQFGDVGIMMGIASHPHHIESLAQLPELDPEFIEDMLAVGPADVRILLAPTSPELADLLMTSDIRAIIHEMSKMFDYIVIDAPAHLEERMLEAIELSDVLIVVTSFNVTAVKDTKISLRLLQSLGIPQEKLVLVLNQTRAKSNFSREEIETTLRFKSVTLLPFDPKTVDESIDTGSPFVLSAAKSEIAKSFGILTNYLIGNPEGAGDDDAKGSAKRRRFPFGK